MDYRELAMRLAGPYGPLPEHSKYTLDELRLIRWRRHLTPQEQGKFIVAAKAMLRDFTLTPKVTIKINKKVSKTQEVVLVAYAEYGDEFCPSIETIANVTNMKKADVRTAIRALARKGLAELHRGLTSGDDGFIHGSGYQLTPAGFDLVEELR